MSDSFGSGHDRAALPIAGRLHDPGVELAIVDLVDLMLAGAVMLQAHRLRIDRLPVTWDWLLAACVQSASFRTARRSVLGTAGRLRQIAEALHRAGRVPALSSGAHAALRHPAAATPPTTSTDIIEQIRAVKDLALSPV
ncbi:hypothetical protein HDA40_002002 [Hamadaea flava]|uniref:Uncharacterized protein n=1 Tax=Hamadaea flava TaxID=1742688 RepID=A0ABV8LZU1_9ACTN|nr:hypothetical protein [Hamadaea flava]MCP2323495.1 hypothetical protein [Hamadaea flava]